MTVGRQGVLSFPTSDNDDVWLPRMQFSGLPSLLLLLPSSEDKAGGLAIHFFPYKDVFPLNNIIFDF